MRPTPAPDRLLGPEDDGKTQHLSLHQRLRLRLPEVPTSGYRWRGADALGVAGVLRLVSSDTELPASAGVGGQGLRCLVFEACARGQVDLHLRHLRRDTAGPSAGEFRIRVVVEP